MATRSRTTAMCVNIHWNVSCWLETQDNDPKKLPNTQLLQYLLQLNGFFFFFFFFSYLGREAVLVQAVLLLVASDARQLGEAETAADPGQFGLSRWSHRLASTDALLLMN